MSLIGFTEEIETTRGNNEMPQAFSNYSAYPQKKI